MDGKKKVDNTSKNDVSNEHIDFEGIVKDALKLHDKLLKVGLKEIAEDALKIHNKLLEIEVEEEKLDGISANSLMKIGKKGGAILQH